MSDSHFTKNVPKKRKRMLKTSQKGNRTKRARNGRSPYVIEENGKRTTEFSYCCQKQCLQKLGEDSCLGIFAKLYSIPSKNSQDLFLQKLIDVTEIKQRRPYNKECPIIVRNASFIYHVLLGTERKQLHETEPVNERESCSGTITEHGSCSGSVVEHERKQVCMKGFLMAYGISEKRMRRIRDLKLVGKIPKDRRGQHIGHALPSDVHEAIRRHIQGTYESHFTGEKDRSIKSLWRLFKLTRPEFATVSYYTYYNEFTTCFKYRFGITQVDMCVGAESVEETANSSIGNHTDSESSIENNLSDSGIRNTDTVVANPTDSNSDSSMWILPTPIPES